MGDSSSRVSHAALEVLRATGHAPVTVTIAGHGGGCCLQNSALTPPRPPPSLLPAFPGNRRLPLSDGCQCPQPISSLARQPAVLPCNDTDSSCDSHSVFGHQMVPEEESPPVNGIQSFPLSTLLSTGSTGWGDIFIVSFFLWWGLFILRKTT